jgi:hypothetical protein
MNHLFLRHKNKLDWRNSEFEAQKNLTKQKDKKYFEIW